MSVQSVRIAAPNHSTTADVLVGYGFNCYRFVTDVEGRPVDVLWSEPGFESGDKRASGSGIPILFPFPGRIQGTRFEWDDEEYALEAGDGRGNAIHGFVHHRPWRLLDHGGSYVTAEFQASVDDPAILACWPSDFYLRATYRVTAGRLSSEFFVENRGAKRLPCGLGTHPYFRLPLRDGSSADDCRIELPVAGQWELEDMNATGQRLPLEDAAVFAKGLRFADAFFDNVFTGLRFGDKDCVARIIDVHHQLGLTMTFDNAFRELVVYTPPHREAICIEPYTCVPDAFRLERAGIPDTGSRVLEPGESMEANVQIEIGQAKSLP